MTNFVVLLLSMSEIVMDQKGNAYCVGFDDGDFVGSVVGALVGLHVYISDMIFAGHVPVHANDAAPLVLTLVPVHTLGPDAQLTEHLPVPQLKVLEPQESSPLHVILTSEAP